MEAATRAGEGDIVAYLERQAEENQVAFLGLLGKILPLKLASDGDNPATITEVRHVIVDSREQALALERHPQGRLDG